MSKSLLVILSKNRKPPKMSDNNPHFWVTLWYQILIQSLIQILFAQKVWDLASFGVKRSKSAGIFLTISPPIYHWKILVEQTWSLIFFSSNFFFCSDLLWLRDFFVFISPSISIGSGPVSIPFSLVPFDPISEPSFDPFFLFFFFRFLFWLSFAVSDSPFAIDFQSTSSKKSHVESELRGRIFGPWIPGRTWAMIRINFNSRIIAMFLWPTQKRKVNTFVHVHISGILIFHVGHFRAVRINVVKTGEEVLFLDWCDHRGFWNLEKSGNIPNRSVRLTWGPSKFLFMSVDDTVLRLCWAQDRLVELKSFFTLHHVISFLYSRRGEWLHWGLVIDYWMHYWS